VKCRDNYPFNEAHTFSLSAYLILEQIIHLGSSHVTDQAGSHSASCMLPLGYEAATRLYILLRLLVAPNEKLTLLSGSNTNKHCSFPLPISSVPIALDHILHTNITFSSLPSSMTDQICASDECRNIGTHRCKRCMTTCYCSRGCQKAHWKTHKLVCNGPTVFHPFRPGVFDFMRLPREVRDKVSSPLV
jgi:hypothetical protein